VRAELPRIARGYGPAALTTADPRDVLVAPALEGSSGVVGALALAADLLG
jgi:fructokinase